MPTSSSASKPAVPSPNPEEPSAKADADVDKIDIASLTLDTPLVPLVRKRRVPATPFHFLSLPSEIRIDIYAYFFHDIDDILDLGPGNYKQIHKKLGLMRVCKQVHEEACYYFYSSRTFRIFPIHPGKYFKTKKPLLARLKQHQRRNITSLQLRLGPGWSAPPRGWVINPALGLQDCTDVEILKVFVQCDPSDAIYTGFRQPNGFYEGFCRDLLSGILEELPSVQVVEFDGFTGVRKCGEMMRSLLDVATKADRLIGWGPERGWTDDMHEDDDVKPTMQNIWLEAIAQSPPS
ncbi:hypothetical protein B0J13DRAFT_589441 [Dactylonectria estremocensis]|uniref:F-box domain-containing protein n=1 Tax=Dactylonectria estremocensis TaxID=1079267 RepID=A0A9P9DK30_9HYPO|nr:hypothetical protein B0J13DRAFT_589441 [Dactylonectria estremocensis]